MRKVIPVILLIVISLPLFAQSKRALTVEDLWNMKRIGSFDLSPDGERIAFTVTEYAMEKNSGDTDIYLMNSDSSNVRALKNSDKSETQPKFTPNGEYLIFARDNQIWRCDLDGGNEKQVTDLYTGASGIRFSKDGSKALFVSNVYPECKTQECNKQKDKETEQSDIKARVIDELMFRHWNEWRGDKRSHLFYRDLKGGRTIDVTLGSEREVPPVGLSSSHDYDISPDGSEAVFTMNISDLLASSTDNDIFIVDLNEIGKSEKRNFNQISESGGNDNQPKYSTDGKYIAFTSMERAGFEADKSRLMIFDKETGEIHNLTDKYDISVGQYIWSPNSETIYFTAANEINTSIYKIDIESEELEVVQEKRANSDITLSPNGEKLYFKQQRSSQPYEIFSKNVDGTGLKQLTHLNKKLLSSIEMNELESFWSFGADSTLIESILIKPPFFDSTKTYPMIFLIHGGPQGHWEDEFHYRWNLQLFASKGYVIVAPNPRGSVGYGQEFTDQISLDWGGKVYEDLMDAYAYALNNYDYIDEKNTFAAGASYGGYMINWIEGNTDRFNALVLHDGVFNLESMYGATEELWFPEWEFGGAPWENRDLYQKWSPHYYVENFATPMLVIHGAKDFRVPEGQAFELFTSLQKMGVESKLLYFPEEDHFIQKPKNSRLWWNTVFNWFDKFKEE